MATGKMISEKKRYLICLPYDITPSGGGVIKVAENLIARITADNCWEPMVLINDWQSRHTEIMEKNGVTKVFKRMRPFYSKNAKIKSIFMYMLTLPFFLFFFMKLIKTYHIRVVNVHFPSEGFFSLAVFKWIFPEKIKLIFSYHGTDYRKGMAVATGVNKFQWRVMSRMADSIIACSSAFGNEITAFDPRLKSKLRVIHNGIDPDELTEKIRSGHPVHNNHGRPFILNIAAFEYKKGQDILIKAFAKIQDKNDHDLVFIGRSDSQLNFLKQLAVSEEIQDRAFFYENIDHENVIATLKNASVFVLPSRIEPFGIVLLEAGFCGIPVIASKAGGIVEIITHNVNGILVEVDDVSGLAQSIQMLISDNTLCNPLVSENEAVIKQFNWSTAYSKYKATVLS